MANSNSPKGFIPLYNRGTSFIPTSRFRIPSSDSTAVYIGDPVILAGTSDAKGIPDVIRATAGATNYVTGVVVSVEAVTNDSTVYRAASTERYVYVSNHPDTIYAIQGDASATPATGDVGNNADFTFTVAGETVYGNSGAQISTTSIDTDATKQLRIVGFVQDPSNEVGAYAKYLVAINLHSTNNTTGI